MAGKNKSVKVYAKEDIFRQIINLSEKRQDIFLEIFVRIIPFGDFYKKDKTEEIIRSEIKDTRLRRRMLRLVELIPEKKSLYLAQKAMECRNMEKNRKQLDKSFGLIDEARDIIQGVMDDEQEAYDNLPENFQNGYNINILGKKNTFYDKKTE